MSKVQEAVNSLLGEVNKRNAKIQEKINGLQKEAAEVKSSIDGLMQDLVNYDLADDEQGQVAANKKIAQLRSKHDDLLARIAAYQGALNDQSIIQAGISKVLDVARKAKNERHKEIENKNIQCKKLEQDIESLKKQLEYATNERSSLVSKTEAKALLPLLKYIEPRKIKYLREESYLAAIIDGVTGELLEQHIDVPVDYKSGPSTNKVEGPNTINYR
jgi:chromosome segregation ATPase